MAVVASEDGELVMQDPLSQDNDIVAGSVEECDEIEEETEIHELKIEPLTPPKPSTQNTQSDPKLQKEMETCFGFDEVSIILPLNYNILINQKRYFIISYSIKFI